MTGMVKIEKFKTEAAGNTSQSFWHIHTIAVFTHHGSLIPIRFNNIISNLVYYLLITRHAPWDIWNEVETIKNTKVIFFVVSPCNINIMTL